MVINGNNTKFDLFLDIKRVSKLHTTYLSARVLELYNTYANLQFFARTEIVGLSCLNLMFGGAIKFVDSQMKYAISQNCSFVSERRNNCPVLPKT